MNCVRQDRNNTDAIFLLWGPEWRTEIGDEMSEPDMSSFIQPDFEHTPIL
jgi:hypothetical protein